MENEIHFNKYQFFLLKFLWISFLILIFSLALMQPFFNFQNLRFSSTDFIYPIVFITFAVSIFFKIIIFKWNNFYWFLLFYFLSMLISAMFSINQKQSFIKLAGEFYILSMAVLTFNLVKNKERFEQFINIWLYGTIVTIFVGLLTLFLFYFDRDNFLLKHTNYGFGAVPVGNYPRLASTFGSASMFCNYLNVSLCFLFIAQKLKLFRPLIFWILLILLIICAVFTISAGFGGIALTFSIWFWLLLKNKQNILSKIILLGGILFAAAFFLINFIALQPHPTAPFTFNFLGFELYPSGRLMIWTETLQTFSNNFFNGIGLGQEVCRVYFQNTDGSRAYLTDAHNIFLSVAGQNGIFGLISFAALLIYICKSSFSKRFPVNGDSSIIFYLSATAFVCAFLYQGLTGSFEDARHLWVLVGLIFAVKTFPQTS